MWLRVCCLLSPSSGKLPSTNCALVELRTAMRRSCCSPRCVRCCRSQRAAPLVWHTLACLRYSGITVVSAALMCAASVWIFCRRLMHRIASVCGWSWSWPPLCCGRVLLARCVAASSLVCTHTPHHAHTCTHAQTCTTSTTTHCATSPSTATWRCGLDLVAVCAVLLVPCALACAFFRVAFCD